MDGHCEGLGIMSTITRRSIRRLTPKQQPDNFGLGEPIKGSFKGRQKGTKVPDYENLFREVKGITQGERVIMRAGKVYVVHFRHPTKKRTPGRVSSIKFFRPTV